MCSKGYNLVFQNGGCEIRKGISRILVVVGTSKRCNAYQLKGSGVKCFMSQTNESWIWHWRMGHINFDILVRISSVDAVGDFPNIKKPINEICKEFQVGKKTKKRFNTKEYSTTSPLELVNANLCGPTKIRSSCGDMIFMLLIDDYPRMAWVTFLK